MRLYINDMDLPSEEVEPLRLELYADGTVFFMKAPDDCYEFKAVPVPPHGRLGDLDALHKLFLEKAKEYKGVGGAMVAMAALCIANAPTIIPAEESET